MKKILIEGGVPLHGSVEVNGSKNAALPILFATLLAQGRCVIRNVPRLRDVNTAVVILRKLGMSCERLRDKSIEIESLDSDCFTAPYKQVSEMRASICALGPLLARRKRACVSMPGGCVFGDRPIDLHLKGLRALGAKIRTEHGNFVAEADRLKGAKIYLGGPCGSSVLGTANIMMAAVLAEGTTVIEAAACEPEIADLANFLIAMGAKIKGVGTPRLEIDGVSELHGTEYSIIHDRIEAGTFLIAGAMTGGDVVVKNANIDHLSALTDTFQNLGLVITAEDNWVRVSRNEPLKPMDITTLPYPGFPTDLQAQMMAFLSLVQGVSVVTERVYPDRFMHLPELQRMGAKIRREGASAIITGVQQLSGAPVKASDLRASASLILAGLVANGRTEIHHIHHLERGYENIEDRLASLGARIKKTMTDDVATRKFSRESLVSVN